jgi:hypothetical protein
VSEQDTPFSQEELETLILALARGHGAKGVTQEDIDTMCNWAIEARVAASLLAAALEGRVRLRAEGGEIRFYSPETQE